MPIRTDAEGRRNVQRLLERLIPDADASHRAARRVPLLVIRHAAMVGARVTSTRATTGLDDLPSMAAIDLELFDLSTLGETPVRYTVSASLPDGATLAAHGTFALDPVSSAGELSVHALRPGLVGALARRARIEVPVLRGTFGGTARYRRAHDGGAWSIDCESIIELVPLARTEPLAAAPP